MNDTEIKITQQLKGISERKLSTLAKLAGLNSQEYDIIYKKAINDLSDIRICDDLAISQATLTRRRKRSYEKLADLMSFCGSGGLSTLSILDGPMFKQAQDNLIRYFVQHHNEKAWQQRMVDITGAMVGNK